MIRDNCLVNISVADRFMKEAVYHIQVGNSVRSIVSMIIQLAIAMKAKKDLDAFQNDDHQSTVADRVAVLTVASARNIDSGVFRCSVRLPGGYTAQL